MRTFSRTNIETGSGADLAFAIVVLTSYLAIFSSLRNASNWLIVLLIGLGIAYISMGIYGYAYSARSGSFPIHLGYFAFQIPLGAFIVWLSRGAGINVLVLLPLAGQAVVLLPRNWLYIMNAGIFVAFSLAVRAYSNDWTSVWAALPFFLAGILFVMVFTQMAVGEEKARSEVGRLVSDLEEANQKLREYAIQVEDLATAKERNRLAREIHDGLGHYLTTIHMQIQAATAVMERDPATTLATLKKALHLTQESLEEVRRSVSTLRMNPDENLSLPDRLRKLFKESESDSFHPRFSVVGEPCELELPVKQAFFRAAQEGLNNIRKHSSALHSWITLDYSDPDFIKMMIRDDGTGKDNPQEGFGLLGLRERLLLLNGRVVIDSSSGQGFTLNIEVPK